MKNCFKWCKCINSTNNIHVIAVCYEQQTSYDYNIFAVGTNKVTQDSFKKHQDLFQHYSPQHMLSAKIMVVV